MIQDRQEYDVELVITERRMYRTFSRTPEEAEADAENMFRDDEQGDLLDSEIEMADAFPVVDGEEEESIDP